LYGWTKPQVAFGAGRAVGVGQHGAGSGARREDDGHSRRDLGERRDEMARHVPDAEAGDDQTLVSVGQPDQLRAVVVEGRGVESYPRTRKPRPVNRGKGAPRGNLGEEPRHALDHMPERAEVRRQERRRAGAVCLAHMARRVDLVVEHDEDAAPGRGRRRGDLQRAEQVRRTVRTGHGRIAHRAGHYEWRSGVPHAVDQEGGLLEGVGPLRQDDADRAVDDRRFGLIHDEQHIREGQRRARRRQRVVGADLGRQFADGGQ
jgi:hypothetical protein